MHLLRPHDEITSNTCFVMRSGQINPKGQIASRVDRYSQNLVFFDDVLVAVKGYVRRSLSMFRSHQSRGKARRHGGHESTHEMCAGLTRHLYVVDIRKSVIQFGPIGFVPALYGTATGRDFTVLRWDPFHIGSDGQEIVPPVMFDLGATVRNATRRVNGGCDLARMNRVG